MFGRSATELTFMVARTLSQGWGPGDEVVVTRLDHDANVRPWVIAAEHAGAARDAGRLRAPDRRAAGRRHRPRGVRANPARRRHRRIEPHRYPPRSVRHRRDRPRGRRAALRRRRPQHGSRVHRRRGERCRLLGLLAVQVPRPSPRGARRPARDVGAAPPGEAAARDGHGARAVRAGDPAVRAAGRDDGGRGLPGRAGSLARRGLPARAPRLVVCGAGGARGRAARVARAADPRAPRGAGLQQRAAAYADPAVHVGSPAAPSDPGRAGRGRGQRAGRQLLRLGDRATTSASAPRAAYASGSRPTPTGPTSSGSWTG